jgi:glucosamine-phosphate N-acetyltransferase
VAENERGRPQETRLDWECPVWRFLLKRMIMDIILRELKPADLSHGFLETLAALAKVDLTVDAAGAVLQRRLQAGIRTFVAVDGERIVGTASLLLEQKFIHGGGLCGHIEEVVVHPDYKNQGIARALVRHATAEAEKMSCYKVILNCFENLVPFYEGCGFRRHDVGMRLK